MKLNYSYLHFFFRYILHFKLKVNPIRIYVKTFSIKLIPTLLKLFFQKHYKNSDPSIIKVIKSDTNNFLYKKNNK